MPAKQTAKKQNQSRKGNTKQKKKTDIKIDEEFEKIERKPDGCNNNCSITEKEIGGIITEFCQECLSVLSYIRKQSVVDSSKKIGISVKSSFEKIKTDTSLRGKIARNKIYHEKCEVTLSRMPDYYLDYIITSPPYNIGDDVFKKYDKYEDNLNQKEYLDWQIFLIEEFLRVTKMHIFYNNQLLSENKIALLTIQEHFKYKIKDIAIWVKRSAPPQIVPGAMNSKWEYMIILSNDNPSSKGFSDANFSQGSLQNVIDISRTKNKYTELNKATFPLDLPRWCLVNFGKPGTLVYDPFNGTGTTGVACKIEGRDYIGSELDKNQVIESMKRIDSYNNLRLNL